MARGRRDSGQDGETWEARGERDEVSRRVKDEDRMIVGEGELVVDI